MWSDGGEEVGDDDARSRRRRRARAPPSTGSSSLAIAGSPRKPMPERGQRDAELAGRQVLVDVVDLRAARARRRLALLVASCSSRGCAGAHERELGRDEEPVEQRPARRPRGGAARVMDGAAARGRRRRRYFEEVVVASLTRRHAVYRRACAAATIASAAGARASVRACRSAAADRDGAGGIALSDDLLRARRAGARRASWQLAGRRLAHRAVGAPLGTRPRSSATG